MDKPHASDTLAQRRQLLASLEAGTKIVRGGVDVTQDELRLLRLEIAYLEKAQARERNTDP